MRDFANFGYVRVPILKTRRLFATLFFILSMPGYSLGQDVSCSIRDQAFVCAGNSDDGETVLNAMASDETTKQLKSVDANRISDLSKTEREDLRHSIEKNRRIIKKFADGAWRKYRRRKLDAAAYEAIKSRYQAGLENYALAMNIYRHGTWFSEE